MMKFNGYPIYNIKIGEGSVGIKATSLVSVPAIDSNFLKFSADTEEKIDFVFGSDEKREIVGAIMIPNQPIFRNVNGNKFYVNFSKEVIVDLTTKMLTDGMAGLFTIQHNGKVLKNGIKVMEVWNKESETDKSVALGIGEPIGTTFMKAKVDDDNIWNHVKEHGLNGFSIELDAMIEPIISDFNKQEKKIMLKEAFSNSLEVNGLSLYFNGELKKSTAIFTETDEGVPQVFDGEFMSNDVKYKVAQGLVVEAENVQVSIDSKFGRLEQGFNAVKELVEKVMKSDEDLVAEKAEFDLKKDQFKLDQADFAKQKENGTGVTLSFEKQRNDLGVELRDWNKKFKK